MGDVNWIRFPKRNVTPEVFEGALRRAVQDRYGSLLVVSQIHGFTEEEKGEVVGWSVKHHLGKPFPSLEIWVDSKRSFSFPYLHPINGFFTVVLRHEIASKLGGNLQYEGMPGTKDLPQPENYTTFMQFRQSFWEDFDWGKEEYKLFEPQFPKDLLFVFDGRTSGNQGIEEEKKL
jgi:hypothetical protein